MSSPIADVRETQTAAGKAEGGLAVRLSEARAAEVTNPIVREALKTASYLNWTNIGC